MGTRVLSMVDTCAGVSTKTHESRGKTWGTLSRIDRFGLCLSHVTVGVFGTQHSVRVIVVCFAAACITMLSIMHVHICGRVLSRIYVCVMHSDHVGMALE